jgi:ATP-dependent RNA helicase DDX49/DBP8
MDKDFEDVPLEDLNLSKWLLDQCKLVGYKSPTPIQYHCIPRVLAGQDIIGCAKTGSGLIF